jgi:hypothetical protein
MAEEAKDMKSLGALIRARNLEELHIIANLWGAPPPVLGDTEEALILERHMRDPISARTLWDHLTTTERQVTQAIVGPSARNWNLVAALPERVNLPESDVLQTLDHLCAIFLVEREVARVQGNELVGVRIPFYSFATPRNHQDPITEQEIAYVPTEIATTFFSIGREFNGIPCDRGTLGLEDLLQPYRQGDIEQIGRRFNLTLQSYSSRNEVRSVVVQNASQPNAIQYVVNHLEPSLQRLYDWIIKDGGRISIKEVCQRMRWGMPELIAAIHTLEDHALAFDAFSQSQRILFIPADAYENLRRVQSQPKIEVGLRSRSSPRSIRPADSTILWDIAALVWLVIQQEVELTRTHTLPKRTVQRLTPLFSNDNVTDDEEQSTRYLTQLQFEAIDLGILRIVTTDDRARLEIDDNISQWGSQDCRRQTLRLLRRWTHNRNWHDRVGVNYHPWMSNHIKPSTAREVMLSILRQCEPGIWYDVRSLLVTILDDDPFVIRPDQRFAGQGGFKMTDEVRAHWDETDGELLCGLLSSTLHELGIVSLGYDQENVPPRRTTVNPDAIMLTELGAEVLKDDFGRAPTPGARALILQPNFEILLLEPHMPALYWLIRIAEVEQLGRASRFKLTRESLLHAISDGIALEDIINFLRDHSEKELAQNVIYTLHDWSRQYKETRVSQVILIEVSDECLASEIFASSKLRDLGLRRIGPNALAAPAGKALRTVRRAIEKAGYATQSYNVE